MEALLPDRLAWWSCLKLSALYRRQINSGKWVAMILAGAHFYPRFRYKDAPGLISVPGYIPILQSAANYGTNPGILLEYTRPYSISYWRFVWAESLHVPMQSLRERHILSGTAGRRIYHLCTRTKRLCTAHVGYCKATCLSCCAGLE